MLTRCARVSSVPLLRTSPQCCLQFAMWGTLWHCCGEGGPPKYIKCPIAEVPDLGGPASGGQLDPVTSRGPLQSTFFCNSMVQWGCTAHCWKCLFPACLGLFSCTLRAIAKCSNNGELAAEQDMAVPQLWGEYSVSPEKSLWCQADGRLEFPWYLHFILHKVDCVSCLSGPPRLPMQSAVEV